MPNGNGNGNTRDPNDGNGGGGGFIDPYEPYVPIIPNDYECGDICETWDFNNEIRLI